MIIAVKRMSSHSVNLTAVWERWFCISQFLSLSLPSELFTEMDVTNKKYYKISEVAEMVGLPMSTLRFWENQFPSIKPKRNDRGTRFYTPRDVETIRMVAYLVKDRGMKLEAAQEELKRNRDGVNKKFEIIERLRGIRNTLQEMLDSLHKLR